MEQHKLKTTHITIYALKTHVRLGKTANPWSVRMDNALNVLKDGKPKLLPNAHLLHPTSFSTTATLEIKTILN